MIRGGHELNYSRCLFSRLIIQKTALSFYSSFKYLRALERNIFEAKSQSIFSLLWFWVLVFFARRVAYVDSAHR